MPQRRRAGHTARAWGAPPLLDVTADLVDFNVNQNAWISSMILYKLGLFGIAWDSTPFFDNKASFQRGINQAVRRTSIELVDTLGRVRSTSQIDPGLQAARGNLQFDEDTWYFGLSPFGPKTPTPSFYRARSNDLRAFNDRLEKCQAVFDARADNLLQFIDRIANDIGATSAILRERSENHNAGWFDTARRRPLLVRLWPALWLLRHPEGGPGRFPGRASCSAPHAALVAARRPVPLGARIQPLIISNGDEAGWLHAVPPRHHGVLHAAGALQPGRDQQRPGAVGIGRLRQA